MSDKPVRFGLIGFGAWGRHHADSIARTPGAKLVAIAARSEDSAQAARETYPDVAACTDYRELLARDDLDAIDIVVPSFLHCEIASAALESGRHVLLEKPMATTVEDCDRLIDVAQKNNRLLAIGHELRLSSLWGLVKSMIDDGYIGDPLYALVELSRKPYRTGADGWRYDISRVGNWILEEPIHFFDLARWYLSSSGDPVSVYATANSRQPDHPELQDNFSAILKFRGGAYAVVSQTLSAFEHHQTVKVTGRKGALWASWSGAMDRTRQATFSLRAFNGDEVKTIPIERSSGELFELEEQIAMFARAVRGQGSLACPAGEGRWSVAMCQAAQKSVELGQPVKFE
ncbi:1,5-anhydro-D-fructose reductase [Caulifigura coniformis]|uniref:1,5-anhydro-D-fructose reductase n=1 Tax=Caulifigura coniformis TaxID=2527983 RepID=A0A517S9V0_9PLAN|nr:Gfo/Idh/MocA family oxidoreductase [Caulifigura coniformis]QDT52915.1 1,5-anhydro-D-fructose reductase [Caulifigura coniformis]